MRVSKSAAVVCTAFALVVGATLWAGEITGVSVTPNAVTVAQGGTASFLVSLDSFSGSVPPRASKPPKVEYCSEWTLHSDGLASCDETASFTLEKGRNYTQNPITALDGYVGNVIVNVDAGVPCPAVYQLAETFTATSGSGVDFGNGLLQVSRIVNVTVTCASVVVTPYEGCSHGYWKNHTSVWPSLYTVNTQLGSVFALGAFSGLSTKTLEDALKFKGGSSTEEKAQILLMQAVAGLLNAAHAGIFYPYTTAELIAVVNQALATNSAQVLTSVGSQLDAYNNYHGSAVCSDPQ